MRTAFAMHSAMPPHFLRIDLTDIRLQQPSPQ